MRQHTEALLAVLKESFERRTYIDVFHGTDRVLQDVPFTDWSLNGGLTSEVKWSGKGTVVYQSESGESVVPTGADGFLSPFRARIAIMMEIRAGNFRERISLGTFRVTAVPTSRNYYAVINGHRRVTGCEVELEYYSLDEDLKRAGFHFPEQPPQLDSVYEELRRITGLPVIETLPDAEIPSGLTYEATQGGRLKAVHALASILGGTPVVNSVGALEVLSDAEGEAVAVLELGEEGTVVDVGYEIDTENVYNVVVGVFERGEDQEPLYAVARAPEGPLHPDGLYGEYTRYYSSEMVKTQGQADKAVQSVLELSMGSQQYDVPITCHVNPLVELGDVVALEGWERPIVGRVVEIGISSDAYMDVTLRVQRRVL